MTTLAEAAATMRNGEMVMMTETFRLLRESIMAQYESGKMSEADAREADTELVGHFVLARKNLQGMLDDKLWRERVSVVHQVLDECREKFDLESPLAKHVACKRGCAACCEIQVSVTRDEAKLLAEKVSSGEVEIDRAALAIQALAEQASADEYKNLNRACVFLSWDKTCRVYEIRPGSCRNYRVLFDASKCGDSSGTRVAVLGVPKAEALLSAAYTVLEVGPLAQMVLDELAKKELA